ncbi:MAG: lipoprotein insertase outer membrane protein LolB [Porticoccus sp.]|nr:lipoprotein insertase outer membrane protein LolB [Porticoccus sp.]
MQLIIPLLLTIMVSACTTTQTAPPTINNWEQHVRQMEQLDQWFLEGKLGYRDSKDGGSAWVNWNQQQGNFDVKLNGPFGAGATRIVGSNHFAKLQRAGHEDITAKSSAALTELLFGWQWPAEQLQFWVRGIPAPGSLAVHVNHNPDGTLALLEQSSWTLTFFNYQKTGHWILPGKIKGQRGDYHFTLVIKNWQPSEPSQ